MKEILDRVIGKITLPQHEKLSMDKELLDFESRLKPQLKKHGARIFIGGSMAKQTLIKRDHTYDIDVFVLFPYKLKDKSAKLSEILEQILKSSKIKHARLHGSRDYFQVHFRNLVLEMIPILEIKNAGQAVNITDISPLHVAFVMKKIKADKRIADEIRLAKAFCYASDCYGAESYIRGFSGYSLEVLVSYYKSFMNFIKAASRWNTEEKIFIDPVKYYKSKAAAMSSMNEAKLISPLVLVDPVQKQRNVTAALSHETLKRFVAAAKDFLAKPRETFFFKKKVDINQWKAMAKKSKSKLVMLRASSSKDKTDVAGAKLKKLYEFLEFMMKKHDFRIVNGFFDFDEKTFDARFYFIIKEPSRAYLVKGPPLSVEARHLDAFRKRWPKAFVKDKRLWAKAKRDIVNVNQLLKSLSKPQLKQMGIESVKLVK